jgi:diguanylate cyclase (GGDEF)-like protein
VTSANGARGPLGGLSTAGVTALAFALVLCVALVDTLAGPYVSVVLLYLGPVAFGTWFLSLRAAAVLSVTSALLSYAADHRTLDAAGVSIPVRLWNVLAELGTYLALALLLAALRNRLQGEQALARTDALTHAPNRRAFFEMAVLEIERVRRHGRPLTFAYVDCDDFKSVNDTLGHAQGDALLIVVARTLRTATRAVDGVARLGGDEFGLLLPETDGPTAEALLERIRSALLTATARNGWQIGFSIGAVTYHQPPRSVDEIMARADALMYEAKRTAKGQVRLAVAVPAPLAGALAPS